MGKPLSDGGEVEMICPECGKETDPESSVCTACGAKIKLATTPPPQHVSQTVGGPAGAPAAPTKRASRISISPASIGIGLATIVSGVIVFISMFLTWVTSTGLSDTGWDLMMATNSPGNILWRTGGQEVSGLILFTGFWALIVGVMLMLLGINIILRLRDSRESAAYYVIGLGLLGAAVATVNMVMIATKFKEAVGAPVSVGVGLYLLLAGSIIGLILGIMALVIKHKTNLLPASTSSR